MKVRDGVYFCPWCVANFKLDIKNEPGAGRKGRVVGQAVCPKCRRAVSQKTKIEMDSKKERGEKI